MDNQHEDGQPDCSACKQPLTLRHVQSLDGAKFCDVPCFMAARPHDRAYYEVNYPTKTPLPTP